MGYRKELWWKACGGTWGNREVFWGDGDIIISTWDTWGDSGGWGEDGNIIFISFIIEEFVLHRIVINWRGIELGTNIPSVENIAIPVLVWIPLVH